MSAMETETSITSCFENLDKDSAEFQKECSKLVQSVTSNEFSIVSLVEQLGTYLVDASPDRREYGTCILCNVIELLPKDFLNTDQLHFICTFFADRLKDHHTVIPVVLKGVLAILQQNNLPEGSCSQILASLFHNVSCQQQQQADRYNIYNIFKVMLEKRADELKAMNLDFVYGVISAADGERDPKNLLYLFRWLPVFLKTISLQHLVEEMFDIVSCYFPVDFRVPTQQANAISRDDLAAALCPCLCAIPEFAEFSIPLALDKLASNLNIAKLDSLELLLKGCSVFSRESYLLHSAEIWPLIQKEALNKHNDPGIVASCYETLSVFIGKITDEKSEAFKDVLHNITDTMKGNLQLDSKLFSASGILLRSVAKGSTASAKHVISEIMPLLMNLYNITSTLEHKIIIFSLIIELFIVYTNTHKNPNVTDVKQLVLIPNLCLKTAIDPEEKLQIVGLISLGVIVQSLSSELRSSFYESSKVYLTMERSPRLHEALLSCLKCFARAYPAELLNEIDSINSYDDRDKLEYFLNGILCLGTFPSFTEKITYIILSNCTRDLKSASVALPVLRELLNDSDIPELIYKRNFINSMIQFISSNCDAIESELLLQDVSSVLKCLIGKQGSQQQEEILKATNVENVILNFKGDKKDVYLYILDGLLARLTQDVLQGFNCLRDLFDVALCREGKLQVTAVQLIANIINKLKDGEVLNKTIEHFEIECNDSLAKNSNIKNVCSIVTWITKALVMRGHDSSMKWINKMVDLLEKFEDIASGFKVVMKDDYECLSTKSYCNRRLLYRQLFFTQACSLLKEKCSGDNQNFLLAFGNLLEEVPGPLLKINFDKILQLLVLCLDNCQDSNALISILTTMKMLIVNKDDVMETHIQDFVIRLLRLTKFESSMNVRMLSLQCLGYYTTGFTLYKLLPLKTSVVMGLGECLDDRKRLVRREATETRMKWFLIDAPKD